jgi:prepilin-type N-terminal cleavage/methylation domain-containing protein
MLRFPDGDGRVREIGSEAGHSRHYGFNEMIVKTASAHHNPAVMQKSPGRSSAFTLIELLVVIAIIAILIGLLFPAFRAVQDQAKRTQAKNDLTQIVNAVNAYYTDYGKYPLVTADTIYGPAGISNNLLFNELRATPSATQNLRQIVFINPPDVKNPANPRSGIATQATIINGISVAIGDFVDPWGTPYNVAIDGGYNNQLANAYTDGSAGGSPSTTPPYALSIGVMAWSYGKDQAIGTRGGSASFTNSDDVISWQ